MCSLWKVAKSGLRSAHRCKVPLDIRLRLTPYTSRVPCLSASDFNAVIIYCIASFFSCQPFATLIHVLYLYAKRLFFLWVVAFAAISVFGAVAGEVQDSTEVTFSQTDVTEIGSSGNFDGTFYTCPITASYFIYYRLLLNVELPSCRIILVVGSVFRQVSARLSLLTSLPPETCAKFLRAGAGTQHIPKNIELVCVQMVQARIFAFFTISARSQE